MKSKIFHSFSSFSWASLQMTCVKTAQGCARAIVSVLLIRASCIHPTGSRKGTQRWTARIILSPVRRRIPSCVQSPSVLKVAFSWWLMSASLIPELLQFSSEFLHELVRLFVPDVLFLMWCSYFWFLVQRYSNETKQNYVTVVREERSSHFVWWEFYIHLWADIQKIHQMRIRD